MWSMFTHPFASVGGGCVSIPGWVVQVRVRASVWKMCVPVKAPQKNKNILSSGSYYITSIIHHTYNVLLYFPSSKSTGFIWQTYARVNVGYFPWGKTGLRGSRDSPRNGPA